ncbi:MAG: Holliday junction resolvase RuvX [Epsilonproteobacteria bacterium]|nr:Holliday junction resolvase RuvX [Campylobacterota bacterium]
MKIAAIDVGLKRIGVAYTPNGTIVVPLRAVIRKNRNQASKDVSLLLQEWGIEKLVVGIPVGNEDMINRIKHFVGLLDFDGDIVFEDENYSSIEVENFIKGKIKYKRDGRVDSLAAKNILERYLKL